MRNNLKPEHKEILDLIENYLLNDDGHHLRFSQALFNLDINQFPIDKNGQVLLSSSLRDIYNDSDELIIDRIKKMIKK